MFETDLVRDLIDARWFGFASGWYKIGFFFHSVYVVMLALYIRGTYLGAKIREIPSQGFLIAIGVCLLFPTIYDGT